MSITILQISDTYVYTKNIVIKSRYEILSTTLELLSQVLFSVMQPLPGQPEDDDKEDMVEYYLSGVSVLLVSVVGVIANIVSGLVIKSRQRDINQTLRDLVVFLALVNSVFLVLMVMVFSLPQFSSTYSNNVLPYIVPTVLPCTSVAMTG